MKLPYSSIEAPDTATSSGQPLIEAAAAMLDFGWTGFFCKWLMTNTVNERTLFAFRRDAAVGPPPAPREKTPGKDDFSKKKSREYRKGLAIQRAAVRAAAAGASLAPADESIS